MSNIIDKIRLSGTDYTLSATSSGVSVVEVTQDEYDALPTSAKTDTSKMYVITDAQAGDLTQYWTSAQTSSAITQATSGKQDTLVSGTNIKTINNESILGSGNIDIQGGGVNVVQTTGTSTTDVMSQDAVTTQLNGKGDAIGLDMVSSPKKKVTFQLKSGGNNGTTISSRDLTLGRGLVYGEEGFDTLSTSGLVETSAVTSAVTSSSTDDEIPTAKAVYDAMPTVPTSASQLTNDIGYITSGDAQTQIDNSISGKVDTTTFNTYSGNVETSLSGKQDTLSAGTGIDITNNVISVTGMVATSSIATVVTSSSTDSEVPSAKCLYDALGDIETLLSQI